MPSVCKAAARRAMRSTDSRTVRLRSPKMVIARSGCRCNARCNGWVTYSCMNSSGMSDYELTLFADEQRQRPFQRAPVRRAQEKEGVDPLRAGGEHGLGVAECPEAVLAVVGAHAGIA